MRNAADWQPTKYVVKAGKLRATTDTRELSAGSRLMADLVAAAYERSFKVHATGKLLDMGCGKVPLYSAYRPYVSDIQCIDWSNSPHGPIYLDKECDLTEAIPYADQSFDTIVLSDVLEHLPEPSACWKEMHRLLKPGGKVLLNVPFLYQIHEAPNDYYRYTEFALRRFADQSGFEVVELSSLGGATEVLADIVAKLLANARLKIVAIWVQALARALKKTAIGKRIRKLTDTRFPLGYFMVVTKGHVA
jgi:2-polyprenyl-3-methyl-5-hydroxy-6-metoxy-1,4-benzoquinol methylase